MKSDLDHARLLVHSQSRRLIRGVGAIGGYNFLDMRDLNNRLRVISFTLKRKSKPHDIDT